MKFKKLLMMVILACCAAAPARAGELWTLDGKRHTGDVALTPEGKLTVTEKGKTATFEPDRVLHAALHPPRLGEQRDAVPSPLQMQNVGNLKHRGSVRFGQGFFTFKSNGRDIWEKEDSAEFFRQTFHGNGEIVARIIELDGPSPQNARVGVAFRASQDPKSRHATVLANGEGRVFFRHRTRDGEFTSNVDGGKLRFPMWLKLVREGKQFTAYKSQDGRKWETVGKLYEEPKVEGEGERARKERDAKLRNLGIDMKHTIYAGMVLTSGNENATASAMADGVEVREYMHQEKSPNSAPTAPRVVSAAIEEVGRGVLTRNGTFINEARLQGSDKTTLTFERSNAGRFSMEYSQVARINVEPLSPSLLALIPARRTGVLTERGEFMEGDIREIANGQVRVNSVIFGPTTYRLDDVASIVLRAPDPLDTAYRVHLTDGSVLMARAISPKGKDQLTIDEQSTGSITVPLRDVYLIRAGSAHAVPLTELPAAKVEGPREGGDAPQAASLFDPIRASWMSVNGTLAERGLVAPATSSVTYTLPRGATAFAARVGVPDRMPAKAAVRFIVLVDGKERYKSPNRSAKDDPVFIHVDVKNAGTVTLKTENAGSGDIPAWGLWGDAVVIR